MTAAPPAQWLDALRTIPVSDIAISLGFAGDDHGLRPCPACGAERRGSRDGRPPVGYRRDGRGWRCHRCGAGGGPVELALHVFGLAGPRPGWRALHDELSRLGLIHEAPYGRGSSTRRRRLRSYRPRPAPPPPPAPPEYPPLEEARDLWTRARRLDEAPEVVAWLRSRGLDVFRLDDLDAVRGLPAGPLPQWAGTRRGSWRSSGHLAVVPLYDEQGRMRSFRARCVRSDGRPKELAPRGFSGAGLVLAGPLGRRMLAGEAAECVRRVGLLPVEGTPDLLTALSIYSDADEDAPVVLGVGSGSWSDAIAARVPSGARVTIRTHDDQAGDVYAMRIARTLADRCQLRRGR